MSTSRLASQSVRNPHCFAPLPSFLTLNRWIPESPAGRRSKNSNDVAPTGTSRSAPVILGGVILALSDEPQSTHAWRIGAAGERRVAQALDALGDAVVALHDRRVPPGRGNIDHIAVGPAAVHVIDAKSYKGARVQISQHGGLFGPVRNQLMVAGRDRTKLADDMGKQVAAVRKVLECDHELAEIPIVPVLLCFIDADFPLFGRLEINGVRITGPKGMSDLVAASGPLDAAIRERLARHLADRLPRQTGRRPAPDWPMTVRRRRDYNE